MNRIFIEMSTGGGMRIRTADILLAKQTLYQLSYTPFCCQGEEVSFRARRVLRMAEKKK